MTTDNQYGWAALVARCKSHDAPLIGTVILVSDVLEVEQARSDAARLAALVLEYVTPDGIRPTAPRERLAEMLTLARTLAGEPAQDDPHALLSRIEETQRGTILLENTSTDPVHPKFEPKE